MSHRLPTESHPSAIHIEGLYGDITDDCYRVTVAAAKTLLANEEVFAQYVRLRKEATAQLVQDGACAVTFLTNVAFALQYVTVPTAQMTTGQAAAVFLGIAKAPTALTITNPVTFWLGVGGLLWKSISMYQESQKRAELEKAIRRHKNGMLNYGPSQTILTRIEVAIFISQAWTLVDDTALFLKWVYCLDRRKPLTDDFLARSGKHRAVDQWKEFVERAEKHAEKKKARRAKDESGKKSTKEKKTKKTKRRELRGEKQKNLNSLQRRMLRYIRGFVIEQGDELERILKRLENPEQVESDEEESGSAGEQSDNDPHSSDDE